MREKQKKFFWNPFVGQLGPSKIYAKTKMPESVTDRFITVC